MKSRKIRGVEVEEFDCPFCGEYLERNKKHAFFNKENNSMATAFSCEECDQAYALVNGRIVVVPFYADGKTEIKIPCETCDKVMIHQQKVVKVLKEDLMGSSLCVDCGIERLRNEDVLPTADKERITADNVYAVAELQYMLMHERISSSPDLLRKAMQTPAQRKLWKDCGLSDEEIDARVEELCARGGGSFIHNQFTLKTAEELSKKGDKK